ncbi:hypothetical protein [Burkholderia contaminans]|uniref:hypothetical protein n=1 Tax=Burkholderia contaminans TaxID=488447 RepID=UPI00158422D5|nr:hypothetical protein [Burkholderia contaminans]
MHTFIPWPQSSPEEVDPRADRAHLLEHVREFVVALHEPRCVELPTCTLHTGTIGAAVKNPP